jgi:hypothetical protein
MPAAQSQPDWAGSAYASLAADELSMRLSLARELSALDLGLEARDGGQGDAQGEDMGLAASLRLESEEGGPSLLAGPGSLAGPARLLADPTSPTALEEGDCVELDSSLESRSLALGLGEGPLSCFALGEGRGLSRQPRTAVAGLALQVPAGKERVSALAAVSQPPQTSDPSSWQADPYGSPSVAAAPGRPCLDAAIVARGPEDEGPYAAALAFSFAELSGPGLAFRLESSDSVGPLDLSLSAAAASPTFLALEGEREERPLDFSAEARWRLRAAASLNASVEAWAVGQGLLYAPLWARKGALALCLPLGPGERLACGAELSLGQGLDPAQRGGTCSLKLEEARREGSSWRSRASLGLEASWIQASAGAALTLSTDLSREEDRASLGIDLALEGFTGWSADSPVLATGSARLGLPLGRGASLELKASLPEGGRALGLAASGAGGGAGGGASDVGEAPVLRLFYRSMLSMGTPASSAMSR